MTVSQRRHYRVSGEDLNGIAVSMVIGTESRSVELLDISAAGAAIAFPECSLADLQDLTDFQRGTPSIHITSSSLPDPLDILCRIAHMQEVDAGVICGVAFLKRIDESINLDRALLRVFNRRGAVRVEADDKNPIKVSIDGPDGKLVTTGLVRDLSLTGMGIAIGARHIANLPSGSTVTLGFTLDGSQFNLPSSVRFSIVKTDVPPGGVQPMELGVLGAEFDVEAREIPSTNRKIANWVMRRQREIQRTQREAARQTLNG